MNIWNKIFIGLILVTSLVFWYLGMRALGTHRAWRDAVAELEQKVEDAQEQHHRLIYGDESQPGIRQLAVEIYKWESKRGRLWYGARPLQVQDVQGEQGVPTAQVSVAVDTLDLGGQADVQQLPVDSIVYVFDERDIRQGGRYLGEFRVTNVSEAQADQPKQLVLEATTVLSPRQRQYLDESVQAVQQGNSAWTICDIMPFDNHLAFAGLAPEVIRELLPAASDETIQAYIRDGEPINPDQPESEQFERQLCDYTVLFRIYSLRRVELIDRVAAMQKNVELLTACLEDAEREEGARDQEIAQFQADLDEANHELAATQAHLKAVEDTLQRVTEARDALVQSNLEKANQIAAAQAKAAELIDARVRAMAAQGQPATALD